MNSSPRLAAVIGLFVCAVIMPVQADRDVYLLGVPDYHWYAGCFGTACGNLMGYWDRHGMRDFYTGPTAGGVAPLDDLGDNVSIRSLWASKAGVDGRPANRPGHIDDYWLFYNNDSSYSYESTAPDPYIAAGGKEHLPDCIGDFIGLSQKKWTNMGNECNGNIDAYSFVYWDMSGRRRSNYVPATNAGLPAVDIQSGLRVWAKSRGYDADVFTQLSDFNPESPSTNGFTYEDVKAEIDAGYPLLVFLQPVGQTSRVLDGQTVNPPIHGVLIYGYQDYPDAPLVYIQTSWGTGSTFQGWTATPWLNIGLSVRGVIGFHPKPRVRSIYRNQTSITLEWDGPHSRLYNVLDETTTSVHRYQIQRSSTLAPNSWSDVGVLTTNLSSTFIDAAGSSAFYRVKLLN
jgi:hypothetical protein